MADPAELTPRDKLVLAIAKAYGNPTDPNFWPDDHEERVSAIASAVEQHFAALSPAPMVPEGWRLVPVEPTDAMIRAFWGADVTVDYNWTEEYKLKIRGTGKYRAMLAASPPPPRNEFSERKYSIGWFSNGKERV